MGSIEGTSFGFQDEKASSQESLPCCQPYINATGPQSTTAVSCIVSHSCPRHVYRMSTGMHWPQRVHVKHVLQGCGWALTLFVCSTVHASFNSLHL